MSARDIDPIVWAAAYAAAFVHLYAEEHGATDVQPGFMSRRAVALERVHAPAAIEIADAAVLALGVEAPRQQVAFTAHDAARIAAAGAAERALHAEMRGSTPESTRACDGRRTGDDS